MKQIWLMAAVLVMAGCSRMATLSEGWEPVAARNGPQPVVVFEMSQGGRLVYELNMRRPELVYPFIHQVDAGYYNGMYVHRAVPGLLVETGEGRWVRRPEWAIRVPQEKGRYAQNGELGVVDNGNGTFGPHVLMMRGGTDLEREMVPPTLVLGWLVEGGTLLREMRKGDIITKAYGRNFPAGPEPYTVQEVR